MTPETLGVDVTPRLVVLKVEEPPKREGGRCYWPVDVRAEGKLWRRFYVTPDGKVLKK